MDPLVNLVAQAAEDPRVQKIKISLYRAAKKSKLLKNIIRAARNGKEVTAFVELKARFDELPNLEWAAKLEKNNVRVVYSLPGIKVHCKVLLIELLNKKDELKYVSYLSTGNFNEKTSKVYCDHALFTGHQEMGFEIDRVFDMLQGRLLKYDFKHLLVAPHELKRELLERIDQEIEASEAGSPAKLLFKVNGLENKPVITKLIRAKEAGVEIDMIVRSTCCLTPMSARGKNNIRIRSIVGRYLEHARVFYFHNNGKPNYYMGSADLMNRNLNRRVEVVFPIYNKRLQAQLAKMFELQLADNVKARKIAKRGTNTMYKNKKAPLNSQDAFYEYLKGL
jgi:polyphosphate kinase